MEFESFEQRNLGKIKMYEKHAYLSDHSMEEYKELLNINPVEMRGKLVLEVGSGKNEKFSKDAARLGIKVISMRPELVDPNSQITDKFFEDWQRKSILGRAQQMPYPSNSFDDVVALFSVPFYLPLEKEGYKTFFKEIIRILKPSGHAYFNPIYKNIDKNNDDEYVPEEFIKDVLSEFSQLMRYIIEPASSGDKECRLIITKNEAPEAQSTL